MGLKVRHNGIITDLSGNEYDPSGLGTKRLKIRAGGSVKEFGLTTDPNASSYCGLNVKVGGSKYYIGRKSTVTESSDYTTTRTNSRASSYSINTSSTGEAGTYRTTVRDIRYAYTYTGYRKDTRYSFKFTGSNVIIEEAAGIHDIYTHETSYSGSSWTRTYSDKWWERDYASTNGVKTGGWVTQQGAWGPAQVYGYSTTYSSTLVSNSRKSGANQVENGSFVGNRTSIYWRYVSSWKTSRAYVATNSYSMRGLSTHYQYPQGWPDLSTITSSSISTGYQGVSNATVLGDLGDIYTSLEPNVFMHSASWTVRTTSEYDGPNKEIHGVVTRSWLNTRYTYSTYTSETYSSYTTTDDYYNNDSSTFTQWVSTSITRDSTYYRTITNITTSYYTEEQTRQSDYTETITRTSTSTRITHNFV